MGVILSNGLGHRINGVSPKARLVLFQAEIRYEPLESWKDVRPFR